MAVIPQGIHLAQILPTPVVEDSDRCAVEIKGNLSSERGQLLSSFSKTAKMWQFLVDKLQFFFLFFILCVFLSKHNVEDKNR